MPEEGGLVGRGEFGGKGGGGGIRKGPGVQDVVDMWRGRDW